MNCYGSSVESYRWGTNEIIRILPHYHVDYHKSDAPWSGICTWASVVTTWRLTATAQ